VAEMRLSRLGEGVFARVERGPAGGRTGHYFGCGFRVVYVSLMPPDRSFHRQWRDQNGLKSLRNFRRGGARRRNIDRSCGAPGGAGDGGGGAGGDGGFARRRSIAAIATAILRCANASMRSMVPVKNREPQLESAATFLVRKRLGFDCRKREPLSVHLLADRVRPCFVHVRL